MNLTNF